MLVGHVAVSFAARRVEPAISLGTWVLAAMLADLLWCAFMIAGIEQVSFGPARGAANYLDARNIALSHSLLMDAIWAALFAAAYFLQRRRCRGAWLLFFVVLSHWPLDWISHRPDMPLAPALHRYFGLGLWASIPKTIIVEGGLWVAAIILYTRAKCLNTRSSAYAFWIGVVLLTVIWYNNLAGPPPPNPDMAPFASLILFSLVIAWAYGIDRPGAPAAKRP